MIRYLIDTDICSYAAKERIRSVVEKLAALDPTEWAISAITYGEIRFGLEAFPPGHPSLIRTSAFLFRTRILDWPVAAAAIYAEIKYRARRQPLGEHDMLIAAHAIAIDATLVTNNIRHFGRMGASLRLENWVD